MFNFLRKKKDKGLNEEDIILIKGEYWTKESFLDAPSSQSPAGFKYFYRGVDKDEDGIYTLSRVHTAGFEPLEPYNEL